MVRPDARAALALATVVVAITACSTRTPVRVTPAPPAPVAVEPRPPLPAPPPAEDPIGVLIKSSQSHFEEGQRELSMGHLERAKTEFNEAIDVLLLSSYGARYDARLREHFDGLVDRIASYEITALAEGDGFTEKRHDPASIDALLGESTFVGAGASVETREAVASDLETTAHDIPIPLNARVLQYIELFQGRLREWFATGLQRGARYLPMIQNVFRAEGLPLDLAYVPIIESAFNPNAVSRAKAQGVWQFMAGTALENGLKRDWYIDERSDPEKATRAAAAYLHTLATTFAGDWHLALASYNGGPGLVQRALKRTRQNDFWALASKPRVLPRETREYVPMILAAMVIGRNPALYGFERAPAAPLEYDTVKLPQAVDVRRLAEWAGTTVAEIQDLNPELRRMTTPVHSSDYVMKVPKGTAASLEERLAHLTDEDLPALKWYTVKKGENLTTIARKLRVSRADLASANGLLLKALVIPGQNLIVPVEPTLLLAGHPDRPAPAAESPAPGAPVSPAQTAAAGESPERVKLVYTVRPGDTLFAVARLYQTTVASLKAWNQLRSDLLIPGARLTIFAARDNQSRR